MQKLRIIYYELKYLKAKLLRYNFIEYFNSNEFRLISMESDIDDNLKNYGFFKASFNDESKINAFINMLQELLVHWVENGQDSNHANSYGKYINYVINVVIKNYIKWSQKNEDYSELLDAVEKIGPITNDEVDILKVTIETKRITLQDSVIADDSIIVKNIDNECVDYAIITALEEEEMEKVLSLFNRVSEVESTRNYIELGTLKTNNNKKVVYASQHTIGLIDAAILATEILVRFKPKFLIMTGVLGGKPNDTNIGDVVIATKVFEVDRGKITDLGFRKEASATSINSKEIKKIHRNKKNIEAYINNEDSTRSNSVKLHFGPIACVNQVIDLEGFFEKSISEVDRKAIALEMESFSIVRTCELINDGNTIPLIIKSVMDNTHTKVDDAKPYAAWTSARVLEYILKNEII